jgi:uncharacterized protein
MKLDNEFEVPRPVDEAWAVLTDLERIAPCMPGAQLTEVEGDTYHGTVKVKVGPMVAQYAGTARIKEKDDPAHEAVLEAKGKERSGKGLASALVTATLTEAGAGSTRVSVSTNLTISGPLAQFGRGAIAEVSGKLLGQFATNLRTMLENGGGATPATGSTAAGPAATGSSETSSAGESAAGLDANAPPVGQPTAAATAIEAVETSDTSAVPSPAAPGAPPVQTQPETQRRVVQSAEAEPVDLMSVAGSSIMKRLAPLVIGAAVVAALVVWLVRRGGHG